MNKEIGLYIAIAFLGITALSCGMLFYQRQLDKEILLGKLKDGEVKDFIDEYKNENIKKLQLDRMELEEVKSKNEEKIKRQQKKLETANLAKEAKDEMIKQLNRIKGQLNGDFEVKKKEISELKKIFQQFRDTVNQPDKEKEQINKNLTNTKIQVEDLNREVQRQQAARRSEGENTLTKLSRLRSEIDKLKEIIAQYKLIDLKRSQTQTEAYDGKVLEVDIDRRFAMINLGSVHRVRIGMQFKVIRQENGIWHDMGTLEITKVMPATSAAVILSKVQQNKICPLCGYKGKPGMRNCPYCRVSQSGDDGKGIPKNAVSLIAGVIHEQSTMDPLNPIIKGDFITNQIYSRDRVLHFTIAGKPTVYTREELNTLITNYGGKIVDKVSVNTDYLVLCQVPQQGGGKEIQAEAEAAREAKKAAEQYGIPIMREIELLHLIKR